MIHKEHPISYNIYRILQKKYKYFILLLNTFLGDIMFIIIGIVVVVGILYFIAKTVKQNQIESAIKQMESQLAPVVEKVEEKAISVVEKVEEKIEPFVDAATVAVETVEPKKKATKKVAKAKTAKKGKKTNLKVAK
jgi:hypothetical protein